MNKKLRVLILIIIVSFLIGILPSNSVLAGSGVASSYQSSGQTKIAQILGSPCGYPNFIPGDVPLFVCSGWGSTGSWITFPLRTWETEPAYPLANYPFYIALGTTAVQNPWNFPSSNNTYPNQVDIRGIKTEIKLVAIRQELNSIIDTNFNGMIEYSYGDQLNVSEGELKNRWHDPVEKDFKEIFSPPKTESAASLEYYENASGVVDTFTLRAFSLNSSYFANNPTTYHGEPAYRVVIVSNYEVQAKVSWQNHRFWEYLPDGTKTVCKPGPSSGGLFNCVTASGQLGHKVTEEVYRWKWGPWHAGQSSVNAPWKLVGTGFNVDSVIWPDGSIHDHMPLLVFQSQPLLTQP